MNIKKILKVLSIIFECSFAGSAILYIYNYYVGVRKYDVIPEALQKNLNIFVMIGIISVVLFIIFKYVIYVRNKETNEDSYKFDLKEEASKNLEEKVTERVIIYKDAYEIPKENRMVCPNCGNVIDKNAFICLKCGFLLKENVFVNKNEEKRSIKNVENYEPEYVSDNKKIKNMVINIGLIVAIVVCLLSIINMAMERGIIG